MAESVGQAKAAGPQTANRIYPIALDVTDPAVGASAIAEARGRRLHSHRPLTAAASGQPEAEARG